MKRQPMNKDQYAEGSSKGNGEHLQLDSAIDRLGLIRHAQGREEEQGQAAVVLIDQFGYCEAAIPIYEQGIARFRRQHNRLGEAILTGSIALIRQAAHPGSVGESWVKLALLYRDAADRLGLGRTLLNEAVHVLNASQADLEEVRFFLLAA